jgi:4-amino-4-deoxy-L-arabinose transferase-like glycosyltransferase
VPTKLPHYVLPAYPALALLSARALHDGVAAARWHWTDGAAALLWGAVALALAGVLAAAAIHFTGSVPVAAGAGIAISIGLAAGMLWSSWRGRPRFSLGVGAALALWITGFAVSLPAIDPLWPSRGVAAMVARQTSAGRPIVAAGYTEPSLVFDLGTATKLTTASEAAAILAKLPNALALVSDREAAAFSAALKKDGTAVAALDRVSGFNYSNGRAVTLTLYEVKK